MKYFKTILILLIFSATSLFSQDLKIELEKGDSSPAFSLQRQDSTFLTIKDIEEEYIVLVFWHFTCSHCLKAMEKIKGFLAEEQPKNLKIISIYPFADEKDKFWNYVNNQANGLSNDYFIHTTDYKAITRRAFSQKKTQPPLIVMVNKAGMILDPNLNPHRLHELWHEIKKQLAKSKRA
jgi:peroxiredoxin